MFDCVSSINGRDGGEHHALTFSYFSIFARRVIDLRRSHCSIQLSISLFITGRVDFFMTILHIDKLSILQHFFDNERNFSHVLRCCYVNILFPNNFVFIHSEMKRLIDSIHPSRRADMNSFRRADQRACAEYNHDNNIVYCTAGCIFLIKFFSSDN